MALARQICDQDDDSRDVFVFVVVFVFGDQDDVIDGDCNGTRIFKQRWLRNNLKVVKSNTSSAKNVAIHAFILGKINKMGTLFNQNI